MMKKLISLDDCLFESFANRYRDPQDKRHVWAIWEGLGRAYSEPRLRPVDARKDHKCVRGCPIAIGDIYFREEGDTSWDGFARLCLPCVAMILYYRGVSDLPIRSNSHWDTSTQAPVREINVAGLWRLVEKVRTRE